MMPHLARHFIEEYTHGDIYRKGLRSLFPDDVILRSQPLPSHARARELPERVGAERSSFAYYAGNEVLQMTENTGDAKAGGAVDDVLRRDEEALPVHRQAHRLVHRAHQGGPEARARGRVPAHVRERAAADAGAR